MNHKARNIILYFIIHKSHLAFVFIQYIASSILCNNYIVSKIFKDLYSPFIPVLYFFLPHCYNSPSVWRNLRPQSPWSRLIVRYNWRYLRIEGNITWLRILLNLVIFNILIVGIPFHCFCIHIEFNSFLRIIVEIQN